MASENMSILSTCIVLRLARVSFIISILSLAASCEVQPTLSGSQQILVGIVTTSEGYPEVTRNNRQYMLARQSRIFQDDIIHTDRQSRLWIRLENGSMLSLGSDSHLVVHRYEANNEAPVTEMSFTSGSVRIQSPLPTPERQRIQLRTPLATVRTSGSDFWSGYTFGENTLDITMLEGQPTEVENTHGTVQLLESGWGTTVIGDSAPQPPKSWPQRKTDQALMETDLRFIEGSSGQ